DINLAIGLKLRDRLVRDMGIEVIMTREGDYFIPLGGRTTIGNRSDADLFMSIHANGATRRSATGLETYFLSMEATDKQAARLAAEENKSAQYDTEGLFAGGVENEDDLKTILRDMISSENMKASEQLAASVQKRMVETLNLPNRGVKQAPFFVLVGSKAPAILVETGFVSNPDEARVLASESVQEQIADALYEAILYYDETLTERTKGLKNAQ
ncbi:N-acetylmuramoyl-L-alanine amidase, partial [bacterium]|nr:N-acetylmuramoyl-L-alanine amidase [bacterium]